MENCICGGSQILALNYFKNFNFKIIMENNITEIDEKQILDFINKNQKAEKLKVKSKALSLKEVAKLFDLQGSTPLLKTLLVELTARKPYTTEARLDFYRPGRWDTEDDLVYMSPIIQTGPSVGQWDGTVGYGTFIAPEDGMYVVELNLRGPWGTRSKSTPGIPGSTATVAGTKQLAKGEHLSFSFSCNNGTIAYMHSVKIYSVFRFLPFP
jgi:hypothetical protein